MPNFHRTINPNRTGSHNIFIQGKAVNINLARIIYKCIHCLADLKQINAGLKCSDNENHYGYIHRDEAREMPEELRFMKISDMFPSEYLRGIDVHEPTKLKVMSVKQEVIKSFETGKPEPAYVMYFEGVAKGLKINLTMAKEIFLFTNTDDSEHWTGKWVTIYRTIARHGGKRHIVVRIREPEAGDKVLTTGKEKPLNKLTKTELVNKAKNELNLSPNITGYVLKSAGLVNGGAWASEKVPQMWAKLEAIGVQLHAFIQMILSGIPFYGDEKAILHYLTERDIIFEPGEDSEMHLYSLLEQYANQQADMATDDGLVQEPLFEGAEQPSNYATEEN